ncbi:MAG: hypothetical protein Ct9H90mP6_04410 [Gammaproteobacteria bacterium]|nr:MAG: hypothetical protein Ct9H90mP6_04410 [Gammaproteobacteria bacterium]
MEKHLEPKSLSFEYGGKEITLETGKIARQATAAVLVTGGPNSSTYNSCCKKRS